MRPAALALIGVVTVAGVVIVVGALLDLGPFGDDEQSLSEQQFLTRADRICAEAHSSFRQAQRKPA